MGLLVEAFGIDLPRVGATGTVLRVERKCQAVAAEIETRTAKSVWVVGDQTGLEVGGHAAWLNMIVGDEGTCYRIVRRRSIQVQAEVISSDYSRTAVHDG